MIMAAPWTCSVSRAKPRRHRFTVGLILKGGPAFEEDRSCTDQDQCGIPDTLPRLHREQLGSISGGATLEDSPSLGGDGSIARLKHVRQLMGQT